MLVPVVIHSNFLGFLHVHTRPVKPASNPQGRKHGHVRYKDFVQAMANNRSARGSGRGASNRSDRRKSARGASRRRPIADDIESLVDRLKAVRAKDNAMVHRGKRIQSLKGMECASKLEYAGLNKPSGWSR